MALPRRCFVIMPFRDDLNYFYLYLQGYLKNRHGIQCERGDHRVLTMPLREKIKRSIQEAEVIIADISGRNPNVFYELGLADAYDKQVVLITQDEAQDIPSDIRHLEFIRYNLGQHLEFLSRLDNALHHVFVDRYEPLFHQALRLLEEFNAQSGSKSAAASLEEFQIRVIQAEQAQSIPESESELRAFLIPKIIRENTDIEVMKRISEWIQ
jgi:hypothetical protein